MQPCIGVTEGGSNGGKALSYPDTPTRRYTGPACLHANELPRNRARFFTSTMTDPGGVLWTS